MNKLKEVILPLVANDGPLPAEWLDHPLTDDWLGVRAAKAEAD
jgi:mRNA interferase YafQ